VVYVCEQKWAAVISSLHHHGSDHGEVTNSDARDSHGGRNVRDIRGGGLREIRYVGRDADDRGCIHDCDGCTSGVNARVPLCRFLFKWFGMYKLELQVAFEYFFFMR